MLLSTITTVISVTSDVEQIKLRWEFLHYWKPYHDDYD